MSGRGHAAEAAPQKPNAVSKPLILTIGHSTRDWESFLNLLHGSGVQLLADVRTVPRSRRNPQFNREVLPETLEPAGIDYVHLAKLGGLRKARPDSTNTGWENLSFRGYADYMQTEPFRSGLDELIELASQKRTAIMCAEAVPWRCHRSLIADALVARGISVEHILSSTRRRPHSLTSFARVAAGQVSYPSPLFR